MKDGALLAKAAIEGILTTHGWWPFSEFLKAHPGAIMPAMPFSMFIQLLNDNVMFSVSQEAHDVT